MRTKKMTRDEAIAKAQRAESERWDTYRALDCVMSGSPLAKVTLDEGQFGGMRGAKYTFRLYDPKLANGQGLLIVQTFSVASTGQRDSHTVIWAEDFNPGSDLRNFPECTYTYLAREAARLLRNQMEERAATVAA
jgi:hypothetical protein